MSVGGRCDKLTGLQHQHIPTGSSQQVPRRSREGTVWRCDGGHSRHRRVNRADGSRAASRRSFLFRVSGAIRTNRRPAGSGSQSSRAAGAGGGSGCRQCCARPASFRMCIRVRSCSRTHMCKRLRGLAPSSHPARIPVCLNASLDSSAGEGASLHPWYDEV